GIWSADIERLSTLNIQRLAGYAGIRGPSLEHVPLRQRRVGGDAGVAEADEVDRLVGTVHDQLGDGATDGSALLDAVPGEAGAEIRVGDLRVRADDRVLVERVVVIVAGPGVHHLGGLERRHQGRQRGPDLRLEEGVVDHVQAAGRRLLV